MDQADFIKILQNAYSSQDSNTRNQNESLLMSFMNSEPDKFVLFCTANFQNTELHAPLRVAIFTVLRTVLKPKFPQNATSPWPKLQFQTKDQLKNSATMCLIDANEGIKKAAANLTALVFVLDVMTDRLWFNLLDLLAQNIQDENFNVKKASITTLGYICELLNSEKITNLPEKHIESLIAGIIIGLNNYSEISNTAILALSNSIQFLKISIQSQDFLDMLFDILVKMLLEGCSHNDEEIVRNTLLCLGEIIKMTFRSFERFSSVVMEKAFDCYKLAQPSIFLATNEFFMKLCRAEKTHGTRYFDNFWQNLLRAAVEILLLRTAKEEDEIETSIIESSSMLISSINELYNKVSFENLIGFVHQNIDAPTEHQKVTSLVVFEAILEHTEESVAYNFINNGFYGMLSYVSQGSPRVKEYTLKLLVKIAQFHPAVFLNDQNFSRAMNDLTKFLDPKLRDSEHLVRLRLSILHCLRLLAENGPHVQGGSTRLAPYINSMFDSMFSLIQTSNSKPLIDMMFTTMFDILEFAVQARNINEFFLGFANFLNLIHQNYTGPDSTTKKLIVESIFVNLNLILTRMLVSEVDLVVPNGSSEQYLKHLFQYILEIFDSYREIMSEGLILCGTIICFKQDFFASHINAFNTKYIFESLKDVQNVELFKAGLEVLNMLSKRYKREFERQTKDIFQYLIDKLQSTDLIKELKINIFHTIADMSLEYSEDLLPYFSVVLTLIDYAVDAVMHFMKVDDPDSQSYADQLKECIVESYLCFTHSIYLKMSSKDAEFEIAFQRLGNFLAYTCSKEAHPSVHYLCTCLGLLLDVWTKSKHKNLVDPRFIQFLMEMLNGYPRHPEVPQVLLYANNLMNNR